MAKASGTTIMSYVAPPLPPPAENVADENPRQRVEFRLWQILVAALTVAVTIWLFTVHTLAGILALIVAKHVLVAVLASGLVRYPKSTP